MTRSRRGFTIMEVMIAMGIFLVVTASIFMVASQSWTYSRQMDIQAQALETARLASDRVNRQLTGASNLANFKPKEFDTGGLHAGEAIGSARNYLYFAKPSAFDNLGEVTEYDLFFYYLTDQETLRGSSSKVALREYRARRILAAQLVGSFSPTATQAMIVAASPNATFTDMLVADGLDGDSVTSVRRSDNTTYSVANGTRRGFIVESTVTGIAAASVAGATELDVSSATGFSVNDVISLGSEELKVTGTDTAGAPHELELETMTRNVQAVGAPVTNVTTGVQLYVQTAVMGRRNEGIVRVPLNTRIHLRNS